VNVVVEALKKQLLKAKDKQQKKLNEKGLRKIDQPVDIPEEMDNIE
jgi:hypothetical protein